MMIVLQAMMLPFSFPIFSQLFQVKVLKLKKGVRRRIFFFSRILTSSFLSSLDLSLGTLLALYIYSSFLVRDFKV